MPKIDFSKLKNSFSKLYHGSKLEPRYFAPNLGTKLSLEPSFMHNFKRLYVKPDDNENKHVDYAKFLPEETIKGFVESIKENGGEMGRTHSLHPVAMGFIGCMPFASFERFGNVNPIKDMVICFKNGYYELQKNIKDNKTLMFEKHVVDEVGMTVDFVAKAKSDGIPMVHAKYSCNNFEFEQYADRYKKNGTISQKLEQNAQPSKESRFAYADATGQTIICPQTEKDFMSSKLFSTLDQVKRPIYKTSYRYGEQNIETKKSETLPYIVSTAVREYADSNDPTSEKTLVSEKVITYAYSSYKTYNLGHAPYLIHMEGIDGREGPSGMFRLLDDGKYIDNSTFCQDQRGFYSFSKLSVSEVLAIPENEGMPTALPTEVNDATHGEINVPNEISNIFSHSNHNIESLTEQMLLN